MWRSHKATLFGILAVAACLGALAWLDSREKTSRRLDLEKDTRVVARQFASRMHAGLERHLVGLQQMANFWQNSEEMTEEKFYRFAAGTLKMNPLCLRIVAVDASLHVRWVYPPEPNRALVGFDVKTHPEGYETQVRAIRTREPVLSPPLRLVGGDQGFILSAPVFRKGEFLGSVVCSFRSVDFFGEMILPEVLGRYEEMVSDSGTPLFASRSFPTSAPSARFVAERHSLGGRTWEMRVMPRESVIRARLLSGEPTFWALGSIIALLAGGAAWTLTNFATGAASRLRTQGEALQKTRERLDGAMQHLLQAEKMTALGELVAGVAHEINNPLAGIMGNTQLALSKNPSPDIRRYLETACSETERAGKIVRNLLAFARKQPPEKRRLGLNGIVEKTVELRAYHFRVSQIEVVKELASDLPMTLLDFNQIQQVLLNLLNNAEQAILEAGRKGSIRIVTRRVGDRIELRISDSGPGVPLEIQNRVFEPFFTTKKEGKGTGLGLSLCYGIVHEHGGNIRLESQPGRGASFVIDMPVIQEPTGDDQPGPSASPRPHSGLRVLVVDDEPSVQGFMVELLSTMGHRVDTASDVPEALRKIAANGHDLIITDMKMPRGSGKDIYRAVADRSPHLARRMVFTTGDGTDAETRRFIRATGNAIILKPCKIGEIEQAIASAMNN